MTGYLIFAGCTLLLAAVYLAQRKNIDMYNIRCMVFGGESAGPVSLTFSILAAWMWTTSVFGSAETYALYGIWGPVSYVVGACIAFAGLIAVLKFLQLHYPTVVTWLEFIQIRYGRRTKLFFYIFAVIVPAYVLVEQGVGIAFILETFYGTSFKLISFLSVIVATAFVFFGGMKTVLSGERIAALIIIAGFFVGVTYVVSSGDLPRADVQGMTESASGLTGRITASAIQYFIVAIVIAFGQIVFDPAYYIKASMARSTNQMVWAYVFGGIIIWGLITLMASLYMGQAALSTGNDATVLFRGPAKAVFSFIIIIIGVSTIAHFMIGMMGVFATDLYGTIVSPDRSERDKIIFGRIMMTAIGISCASMTIALENISLLTIDVFCAIFFAAPCVPLVIGCFSKRNFGILPFLSTVVGIIGGLVVWISMNNNVEQGQFAGVAASIIIPFLIMLIGYVRRLPYDG